MNIIGIDLAKNIFHVCVMSSSGRVLKRARLSRKNLSDFVFKQGNSIIAMEACGGSNYWARYFHKSGYDVRIMSAKFVKPFVKSNKNDVVDAEAICEAALRPRMRFVSPRSEEQQDIQNLHRIRERLVKNRTALSNEIRGLLLEYGITVPKGIGHVRKRIISLIEENGETKSSLWKETFLELYHEFSELDQRVEHYKKRLEAIAQSEERCKKLLKIPGVGVLTATAIIAAVGNPRDFNNARQFSAWLGLVPKQNSTGGKDNLGKISKRGNKYIRKLLVQGAHTCAVAAERKNKQDVTSQWLFKLARRRGVNKAVVALANKTARRIWIVLNGNDFKLPEQLMTVA